MIGRQRNGFGKAMGDMALPADDSVTKRTRLLVADVTFGRLSIAAV
jgi:hypothetical protein